MKRIFSLVLSFSFLFGISQGICAESSSFDKKKISDYHEVISECELPVLRGPVTPDNPYPDFPNVNWASGVYHEHYIPAKEGVEAIIDALPNGKYFIASYIAKKIANAYFDYNLPDHVYITYTVYESHDTYTSPYGVKYKKYILYDITVYRDYVSSQNIIWGPYNSPWLAPGNAYI